jgi:hypothetical protein
MRHTKELVCIKNGTITDYIASSCHFGSTRLFKRSDGAADVYFRSKLFDLSSVIFSRNEPITFPTHETLNSFFLVSIPSRSDFE